MKILVINGSPKGKASNSLEVTRAFLEGIGDNEIKEIPVSRLKLSPCKGCFCCWGKTPGKCVINDDMSKVIEDELWADIIIWSFPLYYYNVPGSLKTLIDRQLPMNLPFMTDREDGIGSGSHPSRYDMSGKRHILISTCGFYSAGKNYDSVKSMFDYICGKDNYETIFCGQGELFGIQELRGRTDEYLDLVTKAGSEYISGGITGVTRAKLNELLYPKEVYEQMADASWRIDKEGGRVDETLSFTRQMAALYNKDSHDGRDRVLEICYTDLGKTYQILLGKDGSKVFAEGSLSATTRIDTSWDVWTSIGRGEIRGDVALAKGMYKVTGDFSLMINWDKYFGRAGGHQKNHNENSKESALKYKKPSIITMLIPWITFWIAVSVNANAGAVIALAVCACTPLIMARKKLTVYDRVSMGVVSLLSVLALKNNIQIISIVAGYFSFGLMWLLSCLTREPVCAAYVKYNYNGEDALNNPIFMKTNYILVVYWGILYILIAVWSWFLLHLGLTVLLQILNITVTGAMGVFTLWFERWYPQYIASRAVK
jgi:multimeric flavodoxin WrbA/putative sterol carrier protein